MAGARKNGSLNTGVFELAAGLLVALLVLALTAPLVVTAVLEFTPPHQAAAVCDTCPVPCLADTIPLRVGLHRIDLYGIRRWSQSAQLLRSKVVTAGVPDTVAFDDNGETWSVWVVVEDSAGARSCPSPMVGVNLTTATDPPGGSSSSSAPWVRIQAATPSSRILARVTTGTAGRLRVNLLDVQGRRLATLWDAEVAPGGAFVTWSGPAGVYFLHARQGGATSSRRVVLVR